MSANYAGKAPFAAHARAPRGTRWSGTFPFHLLSLTTAGGAVYDLPDGRVAVGAGDLLHFAPQARQDWRVDGAQGWNVHYLIVELPASLRGLLPEADLAPGMGRVRLDARETRRIAEVFRELQTWGGSANPLRGQLVLNLAEHILLRLRSRQPLGTIDPRVGQACEFLHDSVESPTTLDDVARAAGLSRARVCALFQAHLGTTPMAYLEQLRLERAARLLLFTADGIGTIADRLGYNERGYFDKRFKRRWGVTPRSYRRGGGMTAPAR